MEARRDLLLQKRAGIQVELDALQREVAIANASTDWTRLQDYRDRIAKCQSELDAFTKEYGQLLKDVAASGMAISAFTAKPDGSRN